jgi:hypothetical protein
MRARLALVSVCLAAAGLAGAAAPQTNPFLGKWNMTGTGTDAANVYWLEIKDDAGTLSGMFLNRVGNPNPLALVKVENGELVFNEAGRGGALGQEYRAKLEDGKLVGHHTITVGGGRGRGRGAAADPSAPPPPPPPPLPPTTRDVNWIGVRPPSWPANLNANAAHSYDTPVVLFDGSSLDAFGVQNANRPMGWTIEDRVMTNGQGANNLVSKQKFKDFKVEAEYKLGEKSNSGLYLRGRYELQIFDDLTAAPNARRDLGHMAIYGRTPASTQASKAAGEWQTMTAVIVGNRVTVTLNGTRVHDNAVIEGITGGALDNNESEPGPILIQGDHSGVWFRKVVVTPIK